MRTSRLTRQNAMALMLLIILIAFLPACGGMLAPPGWRHATPEQINALATIKDAGLTCTHGVYAGATLTNVSVDVDRGIPAGLTIKSGCEISMDTKPTPKPAQ